MERQKVSCLRVSTPKGEAARILVEAQAKDESLWFDAQTAPEAYLQAALRRLHAAVEGRWGMSDDYVLVPREPTEAMLIEMRDRLPMAGVFFESDEFLTALYAAAIAAAPERPPEGIDRWVPANDPPDTEPVLGVFADGTQMVMALTVLDGWVDAESREELLMSPTHWMPLPPPPACTPHTGAQRPAPALICPFCGADRYTEPCRLIRPVCPMRGTAA